MVEIRNKRTNVPTKGDVPVVEGASPDEMSPMETEFNQPLAQTVSEPRDPQPAPAEPQVNLGRRVWPD